MNKIKQVLEEKHMTQTRLSEELGKSYNMVNSYAQNRRQPSLEVLYEIAELLNIDVKELIVSNKINYARKTA
jgi:putative transcriptional regulator